ncbi:histidine kinase [Embleya sp. AB8]|uniref:sensor histidine kinase n=1 Tax=Embleya sp. AB8 TaxID=3156304 RepID=UPI003C78B184
MNPTTPRAYPSREGRLRRCLPLAAEVAFAFALCVVLSTNADWIARRLDLPLALVYGLHWAFAATLVLRRYAPVAALVASSVTLPLATMTPWAALVWVAMAAIAYGAQSTVPRRALWALGMAVTVETLEAALVDLQAGKPLLSSDWPVQMMAVQLAAWVTGWSVARGRAHSEGLRLQAEQRAAVQVDRARRAVSEERLDIARELHDIVAHSLSIIAVQSGVANHLIHTRPAQAADALAAIEETSRSALMELRSLVGLLRDREAAEFSPGGLADLEGLIARSAQAGVRVDVTAEGAVDELPHGVDRAAYRIVQEALTNVSKHAQTPRARLELSVTAERIDIEVTDDGVGRVKTGRDPGELDAPGGHGLVGIRERAALYGGVVSAGPRAEGGFRVAVRLPVHRDLPTHAGAFVGSETGAT